MRKEFTKKGFIVLVMLLALMLTFTACQKQEEAPQTMEVATTAAANTEVTAPTMASIVTDLVKNMPDHIYKIDQKEFIAKVQNGDDMVIIDIRSQADYEAGHVKGAINVPWGPAIAQSLTQVPKDKEVMVYCYTGQTAGQAVIAYNAAGIPARSVNLGFKLGISKVEGYDSVNETAVNAFGDDTYPVEPVVQEAVTAYFDGLAALKDTTYASYKISEDDLNTMIQANDSSIYILSVRKAEDFAKAHIQGANNIPFGKAMLDDLSSLPMDKKIVVYCYTGQTAGQATAALRYLGYDAVSLNGGMGTGANAPMGWMNKGFLVVSDSVVQNSVMDYFANMPEHIYKIDQKDFVERVQKGEDAMIIDLRSADDYAKGHVQGAINVPFGPAVAENLSKMTADKEVWIYCYTGQTAGQAVLTLNVAGIPARSVNLGYNLGISKVEGYDSIITTDASDFAGTSVEINPEIQEAIAMYYDGLAEVKGTNFATYKVSEDNLSGMIEAGEDFFLLSARKAEDYAKGHIQGAVNIPFGKDMMANLSAVPKDKKVVVYCYTGQTAGQAVAGMRLLGYDAVSLNGGTGTPANAPHGWTNHGYELVQ